VYLQPIARGSTLSPRITHCAHQQGVDLATLQDIFEANLPRVAGRRTGANRDRASACLGRRGRRERMFPRPPCLVSARRPSFHFGLLFVEDASSPRKERRIDSGLVPGGEVGVLSADRCYYLKVPAVFRAHTIPRTSVRCYAKNLAPSQGGMAEQIRDVADGEQVILKLGLKPHQLDGGRGSRRGPPSWPVTVYRLTGVAAPNSDSAERRRRGRSCQRHAFARCAERSSELLALSRRAECCCQRTSFG